MSSNQDVAAALEEMARLMELLGEDSFRSGAHSRAARAVEGLSDDITALARDKSKLTAIEGIGPKLADKIMELCSTGAIKDLIDLRTKVPAGLLEIMQVPGLGSKTVRLMWQAGITDIPGLKKAIDDGSLLNLPRMGAKAVAKIKESLAFAAQAGQRTWLGKAAPIADIFAAHLRQLPGVERVEPAGSLRRGRDTIGDIDILVALKDQDTATMAAHAAAVAKAFCTVPGIVQVIAQGEGKCSVRYSLAAGFGRWKPAPDPEVAASTAVIESSGSGSGGASGASGGSGGPSIQVDLRILPNASFGSALMYFTGSKEHNVHLRERALAMNYTLSEWGLFPLNKKIDIPPQQRGVKPIASATEEQVFAALGFPWIPPEAREDRGELDESAPWNLIEVADIKSELHAHTTASDGNLTILELAEEAKKRGFHTIAVTDHSQSSSIANGLKPDRLRRHIDAIRAANDQIKGITILAGSEVDILADGSLDYKDELLALLDIVVASPHAALSQDPATATKRLLKAITHPLVHILGHPTGRLILRRPGTSPDMAELFAAANEHNTALEINAHWMRLDLRDIHVRAAVQAGCTIAINCDDHERSDFDNLRYGVMTARRGWLRAEQCVNTWAVKELHAWLKAKR